MYAVKMYRNFLFLLKSQYLVDSFYFLARMPSSLNLGQLVIQTSLSSLNKKNHLPIARSSTSTENE